MSKPLVSFILATYNRRDSLIRSINSIFNQDYDNFEIVIICNSTDLTPSLFRQGGQFYGDDRINYNHYSERMGVIRARNRGYEISSGDICITIDDDAVFENPNVTKNIVKHFQQNQEVGIVAMRVINFFSGDIEFPHQGSHLQNKIPFIKPQIKLEDRSGHVEKTTLFMGCGNAIHRKVFEEIGRYSPIFDYGVEEFDLSLRVLDAGFDIVYDPESTVIHYESPKGRFSEKKVQKELYKNRLAASVRNHPIRYVLFSLILWTCRLLIRSNGDIVLWIKSLAEFSRYIPELLKDRDPLSEKSIRKINELNGRVY